MRRAILKHLCCPKCRAALEAEPGHDDATKDAISIGTLRCVGCAASFPVRDAIPRFVPDDQYAGSFGYQWTKFRRTQLDSVTGIPISGDRLFAASGWPRDLSGQLVLEAGSGAGRFTEILVGTGATVVSFDLSSAVDANSANNGHAPNLTILQASIFDIPVREGACDKVICLGVLQHTPDPARAFSSLVRLLRPGGEIVIDVYARRWRAMVGWKYVLRPLTKRMRKETLYRWIERVVDALLPASIWLEWMFGRAGARLLPIVQYSRQGLSGSVNREWAILDTFDMYSPAHDRPQTLEDVRAWFHDAGLAGIYVAYGPNGVVARGTRPLNAE